MKSLYDLICKCCYLLFEAGFLYQTYRQYRIELVDPTINEIFTFIFNTILNYYVYFKFNRWCYGQCARLASPRVKIRLQN